MANALYPKWKEALLQNSADSDLDGTGTTGVPGNTDTTGDSVDPTSTSG
jgi:hypothetical protein